MKNLYLVLAILGGVIPYLFFFQFIQLEGLNVPLFIKSLFVNGAAGGFSIIINLTIGLSCALPAYLYAKMRVKNATE